MRGTQIRPKAERNRKISGVFYILLLQLALIHHFISSSKPYSHPLNKKKNVYCLFYVSHKIKKVAFFLEGGSTCLRCYPVLRACTTETRRSKTKRRRKKWKGDTKDQAHRLGLPQEQNAKHNKGTSGTNPIPGSQGQVHPNNREKGDRTGDKRQPMTGHGIIRDKGIWPRQ